MAKNILQDIVPPERRSIRSIPVPNRGERSTDSVRPVPISKKEMGAEKGEELPEVSKVYPYEESPRSSFFKKKSIWIAGGLALLIVLFAVSSLFAGATVFITPKQEKVSSDGKVVLKAKQAPASNDLEYQVITISKDLGKTVTANGEEHIERKASGKIIIYNTFDASSQRLIKNTRFETPEGLIYRINESVVVPGRTGTGAQMSPGSVEVTVYADEPGEKYNIGLKDFTIPGFKNDPRFKAVYARSKTEMTGGFVGNVKKVAESDLVSARKELQESLMQELKDEVASQLPEDFILYDEGTSFTFVSLPQSDPKGSTVQVNEQGTLSGIIFDRSDLSAYILSKFETSLPSESIQIANLSDLGFVIENKESFNSVSDTSFNFTIQGDIVFVSEFDAEKLKNDLVDKSKNDLDTVMTNYPGISKAQAVIRPFWKRSFPGNPNDITIETVFETSD